MQRPLTGTQVLTLHEHWPEVLEIAREIWGTRAGEPDPATIKAAGVTFLARASARGEAAE